MVAEESQLSFDDLAKGIDEAAVQNKPITTTKFTPPAGAGLSPPPAGWPDPLGEAAFHGLLGDFVRSVEPHTEADPAALLVQFLAVFGNIVGRGPHFMVESTAHHMNIYVAITGQTSKARKGTALDHVKRVMAQVDPVWASENVVGGLTTGEGLIHRLRDQQHKADGDDGGDSLDIAPDDKRLLVVETELASVLSRIERQGNTLSPVIRQAWDDGHLAVLTKKNPERATDTHFSLIGHITCEELRKRLADSEVANGFANRFIFVATKRSKLLPEGGRIDQIDLTALTERLSRAVETARTVGEMRRDEDARVLWADVYADLSHGHPGLYGAVVARAEAQVMRLSCLYALLDESPIVKRPHLEAALALWDYADASARFVFGDNFGDRIADRIAVALPKSPEGMTRTEIRDLFGRNLKAEQIEAALDLLDRHGRIRKVIENIGIRPTERWFSL